MHERIAERCSWSDKSLLAEAAVGSTPTYRLLDHEGTLAMATDAAGNGSYNSYRPQSRYMYVNGNPMGDVDPSGEAGAGILTGIGGNPCIGWKVAGLNPCNPLGSLLSMGISHLFNLKSPQAIFDQGGDPSSAFTSGDVVPLASFAFTISCNFFQNSDLCGQSGWTSAVFTGKNKWVGTLVNDTVAYIALADSMELAAEHTTLATCFAGGFANPACDVGIALFAYSALNDLFQFSGIYLDLHSSPVACCLGRLI